MFYDVISNLSFSMYKKATQRRCDFFASTVGEKWLPKEVAENFEILGCEEAPSQYSKYNTGQKSVRSKLIFPNPDENFRRVLWNVKL